LFIFLFSCQDKKKTELELAIEQGDTAMVKKLAKEELGKIRASISDSAFASILDASLAIQELQLILLKEDTSRRRSGLSDSLITSNPNGQKLYSLMMRVYSLGLKNSSRKTDNTYFYSVLKETSKEWIANRFFRKPTYEALISLNFLQKDVALISAIESKADNSFLRKELDRQYDDYAKMMRKSVSEK
jgi:hypothetical protein